MVQGRWTWSRRGRRGWQPIASAGMAVWMGVALAAGGCADAPEAGAGSAANGVAVPAPAAVGAVPGASPGAGATPAGGADGSAVPGGGPAPGAAPPGQVPGNDGPGGDSAGAAGNSAPPGQTPAANTPPAGPGCLQGGGDYEKPGPYTPARMDVNLGGAVGAYTLFYPATLDADCKHPIIAWGNGTGVTGAEIYSHFNNHAASWGFVVLAAHTSNAGSGDFHRAAIDWLLAANDDPSSMLFGKLSPRAGVSGHSQGGFGATNGAAHPNVEAEVCVQGGGTPPAHVAFMCLTGAMDFVNGPCTLGYDTAAGPAFLADHQNADHIGTPTFPLGAGTPAGLQYTRLHTAWFRCFLADDLDACALFEPPCTLCSEPGWVRIEGKNM